jgi:hypothetical protein
MKQTIIIAALAAAFATTTARAADWVSVAESARGYKWRAKVDTYQRTATEVRALFEVRTPYDAVSYEYMRVTLAHCEAGVGQVVISSVDGQAKRRADFAFGGDSVMSTIAEALCHNERDDERPVERGPYNPNSASF